MDEWGIYKETNERLVEILRTRRSLLCDQAREVAIQEGIARLLEVGIAAGWLPAKSIGRKDGV